MPAISAIPAAGEVFTVTKTADTLDGACDADCSLREAVGAANARAGLDFIRVGPGTYGLTRVGPPEGGNASGDLDVRDDLVILGAGADRTVLDGNGIDRVLEGVFGEADLEVRGVTVRNGRTSEPQGPYGSLDGTGGGIRAEGALTLVGCHVTGNRSVSFGGGAEAVVLIARDSTFSDNEAQIGGGVSSFFAVELTNVTLSGNRALNLGGGAFLPFYSVDLAHVTATGNRAREGGGLRSNFDVNCPGLCEMHFSMESSLIAGNTAAEKGPDCWSLSAPGPGHVANVFGVAEGCSPDGPDRAGTAAAPLDPRLSALGSHGGPTPTHALLPDSPAIDLAPSITCSGADQRGLPRPADGDGNGALGCDAGAVELSAACVPGAANLCLQNGRFRVTAAWKTATAQGTAQAVSLTSDTGAFWFFNPANLELTLKVLDGCEVNDRFWVFVTGLTDVQVEVRVEDTQSGNPGITAVYASPGKTPFQPRLDTSAFVCP
jgi:CSLREA domain-containing protein